MSRLADLRQLAVVAIYLSLLGAMFFVPEARHPAVLLLAMLFGWLSMLVNHNVMHLALFDSKAANTALRLALSFGAMFPVSSLIPAHNIIHHHFGEDGLPDWADPKHARFKWNLANILHFPNVIGPITFDGTSRWGQVKGRAPFRAAYGLESAFAFGLTGALLLWDFWTTLCFIMIPQLFSARSFLRINIIQHEGTDTTSKFNHSRNFVGTFTNWLWMNGGYHTIHHDHPTLHWTELKDAHEREVAPKMHPSLAEKSFAWYLIRSYLLTLWRPEPIDVAAAERGGATPPQPDAEALPSTSTPAAAV